MERNWVVAGLLRTAPVSLPSLPPSYPLSTTPDSTIICGGNYGCDGAGCSCVDRAGMMAVVIIPLVPVLLLMLCFIKQGKCVRG